MDVSVRVRLSVPLKCTWHRFYFDNANRKWIGRLPLLDDGDLLQGRLMRDKYCHYNRVFRPFQITWSSQRYFFFCLHIVYRIGWHNTTRPCSFGISWMDVLRKPWTVDFVFFFFFCLEFPPRFGDYLIPTMRQVYHGFWWPTSYDTEYIVWDLRHDSALEERTSGIFLVNV